MSAEHKNLTGSDLHEPKGCAAASLGQVYTSNGAGSGVWQSPQTGINNSNKIFLNALIPAMNAASSVFIALPIAGKVVGIDVVLNGAITVANNTVSAKINGVAVTGSSMTILFSGSAAGVVTTSTPSAANSIAAHGALEIVNAGTATGAVSATVTVTIDVS